MLAAALRAETDAFVAQHAEEILPDGRQRVVRHSYGSERSILTGIGALDVQHPKVRDRATDGPAEKKIRFTSAVLPEWARRSRSLDALLPVLYLRGISLGVRAFLRTGGSHALTPGGAGRDLGERRPNRSPGVISRLTGEWQQEYDRWQRRGLSVAAMSTSRPTASPFRPGWNRRPNARWLFSGSRPKGRRNSSASGSACAVLA
jgi:putative transposase